MLVRSAFIILKRPANGQRHRESLLKWLRPINSILETRNTGSESPAGPTRVGPAGGRQAWLPGVFMLYLKLFQLNCIVPIIGLIQENGYYGNNFLSSNHINRVKMKAIRWLILTIHRFHIHKWICLLKCPFYSPPRVNSSCVYVPVCTVPIDRVIWYSFSAEAAQGNTLSS